MAGMTTTGYEAIDKMTNGLAREVPLRQAAATETMTTAVGTAPGVNGSTIASSHPVRTDEIHLPREANARVFHVAFYVEEELDQIAEFIRFDRRFYLAENPDVAATGEDSLRHYLTRGIDETRLPSNPGDAPGGDWLEYLLGFDAAFYEKCYPDTNAMQHSHFMRHGAREQRHPFNLHENLASEQLLIEVLDSLGISSPGVLEEPARHGADRWSAVPDALLARARLSRIVPKRYRNNFWLGMALGLLAQCRFGAAVCCYNFFFNYYIPVRFLGNGENGIIGAGCIFTTIEGIARSGTLVATPGLARDVMVADPVFLNRPNRDLPPTLVPLPRPVYGILPNVEAIGGSSLMIQDGHVVVYDYVEYGAHARELQSPSLLHIVGQNCSFRIPSRIMDVDEAFSMLHDHSHNYHHWLLEILPRYLLARLNGLPGNVPLLIERDLAPQIRDVLRLACRGEPALIEVARGASVLVNKLHVATDICVNTVHTEHEPERGDILFSPSAIAMLRELASPYFATAAGKYENVLIVRKNVSFRRLVNQGVLLKGMQSMGLWAFDPGHASWADQVRVFSNASLIVSEAGAALANLVFCRPGANIIVLVNGHRNSNYYYLTQLAQLVGARLYFFECVRLTSSHPIGVQDDMIAPVGQLMDWVRRFLADPNFLPFGSLGAVVKTLPGDAELPATELAAVPADRRMGRGRRKTDLDRRVVSGKADRRKD